MKPEIRACIVVSLFLVLVAVLLWVTGSALHPGRLIWVTPLCIAGMWLLVLGLGRLRP